MLTGVTGKKFHGKDTVSREFTRYGYVQMRFADPLKAMLAAFYSFFNLSDSEVERRLEGDLKEKPCPYLMGRTPRYAMQTLGTEWGRTFINPMVWVATLVTRANASDKPVVVSDLRFPNEADAIRAAGGRVVKVVATDAAAADEENIYSQHPSETEIDKIRPDAVIHNDRRSRDPIRHAVQAILQAND